MILTKLANLFVLIIPERKYIYYGPNIQSFSMLALLYNNTSVYTNILSCRRGRVEDEIPAYKTEHLYIPSICTINDLYHDQ